MRFRELPRFVWVAPLCGLPNERMHEHVKRLVGAYIVDKVE